MTKEKDIRLEQRFSNYKNALKRLAQAIEYAGKNLNDIDENEILSEIIKEGLIQRFEYTYELAWNVMKDYAFYQGNLDISGSRDAIRFAFSSNLITNGDLWMEMIKSRIKTSYTYNEEVAKEIYQKIVNEYYPLFVDFKQVMEKNRVR